MAGDGRTNSELLDLDQSRWMAPRLASPRMNQNATEQIIDVRTMPPRLRHPTIFNTWDNLAEDEALLIVNDHDPVPLYYQFAAEQTGGFHWEYLEQGPDVWRVRIAKGQFSDPGFVPTGRPKHSCSTARPAPIELVKPLVLDTRPLFARGEKPCQAIDDAVASLIPGQPFVVLVPFDPVPLYAKLGHQGFSHRTKQLDENTWQVEFRKTPGCSH